MKNMFLHTSSIEAAHICGAYVILILGSEHDKSFNKGKKDLTKLNTEQATYVEGFQ
jgi:hypothetical protein